MPSPVVPSQFSELVPSPVSSICTRVKNTLILLPSRLSQLVAWMLDDSGNATDEFIRAVTSTLIPSGVVMPYLSEITPTGWLQCHGAAVSRTTYANLFAVIGTRYGAGDGGTTFNLPDFRGRVLVGAGNGTGLTLRSLGDEFGEETHTLITQEIPSHVHDIVGNPLGGTNQPAQVVIDDDIVTGSPITKQTSSVGADQPHENCQPSAVAFFIIKI